MAAVLAAVHVVPVGRPGDVPDRLAPHRDQIAAWLAEGLRLTKIYRRLRAQGDVLPAREGGDESRGQLAMNTREVLLERARELAQRPVPSDDSEVVGWASNVLTLLETVRGSQHPAILSLRTYVDNDLARSEYRKTTFHAVVRGAAQGLLSDLEKGLLPDLATRIRAEVEGDLLAQVRRLLEEHLKDPAAMLLGAVLEDALRQLCRKHGVPEGDTIESMNQPLRKAGVYGLPQKEQVTAWAAIRNKADHGRFTEYVEAEVRTMHQGVSGFIATKLGGE